MTGSDFLLSFPVPGGALKTRVRQTLPNILASARRAGFWFIDPAPDKCSLVETKEEKRLRLDRK